MLKISIIGNGNLSKSLVKELLKKGYSIEEMYALNFEKLKSFCSDYGIKPLKNLSELNTQVDLIIMAISDDSIFEVVNLFPKGDYTLVHTSGSIGIDVFEKANILNYGVFYPLYAFDKEREEDFTHIPIMIESSNGEVNSVLFELATHISDNVSEVSSKDRKLYHLSGVLANNFTNHIWALTQEMLAKNNLEFDHLKPIIEESARNVLLTDDVRSIQTGPAKRANTKIIDLHLKMLEGDKGLYSIYKELTESILNNQK